MKAFVTIISIVLFLMGLTLSAQRPAAAQAPMDAQLPERTEPGPGEDLGYGLGSVMASIFYSPLKVTYAGLGLLTGGVGWVLTGGNPEVANGIIYPAVKGDYIIKPDHLKGTESLIFVGPPANNAHPQTVAPAPPPGRSY